MNYRKLYEKHYNIKIPKGFDIHHIDGNRQNNNIDNLLLLPRDIHKKYHSAINNMNYVGLIKNKGFNYIIDLSVCSSLAKGYYFFKESIDGKFNNLFSAISSCELWIDYKRFLDNQFPNIFTFDLRKESFDISGGYYVR